MGQWKRPNFLSASKMIPKKVVSPPGRWMRYTRVFFIFFILGNFRRFSCFFCVCRVLFSSCLKPTAHRQPLGTVRGGVPMLAERRCRGLPRRWLRGDAARVRPEPGPSGQHEPHGQGIAPIWGAPMICSAFSKSGQKR